MLEFRFLCGSRFLLPEKDEVCENRHEVGVLVSRDLCWVIGAFADEIAVNEKMFLLVAKVDLHFAHLVRFFLANSSLGLPFLFIESANAHLAAYNGEGVSIVAEEQGHYCKR